MRNAPWRSRPAKALVASTLACVAAGFILPFTPLAGFLGFIQPPASLLATIILMVAIYLVTAKAMTRRLYSGHFDQQL